MFYARVLTGASQRIMPNDSSLKKPPAKTTATDSGIVEYFDSVTGETGNSQVFMLYENARAVPEYLITYK